MNKGPNKSPAADDRPEAAEQSGASPDVTRVPSFSSSFFVAVRGGALLLQKDPPAKPEGSIIQ